jgi:hypothetical protein
MNPHPALRATLSRRRERANSATPNAHPALRATLSRRRERESRTTHEHH